MKGTDDMKQIFKLIIIVIFILISIIMFDTLQAIIFKNSPIISWYGKQLDKDSYVDRGIIIDTYYCTKEKDIVTIIHYLKNTKFNCPIDNEDIIENKIEISNLEGISMDIKDGTLTNTGVTVIITDITGNKNTYGEYYHIEKLINSNEWQIIDVIYEGNYGFNLIGYHVNEFNKLEFHSDWSNLYGKLSKGIYRLVKEVNNKYFAVEFEIK